MTERRRIEVEVEVPVTPEEAWAAIATGPGITAWFMPAEVDEHVGGSVVHHHEADMSSSGTVTAYEAPHRFAYEENAEEFAPDDGPPVTATEFLVEARGGGTCVVRVVMSGFGDGEAWDQAIESFTAGWQQALTSLRLYLTHFRGEPVAAVNAGGFVKGDHDAEWEWFTQQLGLPAALAAGERVATEGSGVPALAGTVERAGEHMMTLVLDTPARGIGLVGAGGAGDETFVTVRAQLFGPEAEEVAAREQAAWKAWFAGNLDRS
ncbi:MAG TPA: SRPBCC domain-containing protein [Jiangellaceae bacterium]|nr:SRPBCC domain-containing protein [Jiangellaceae bacterium]